MMNSKLVTVIVPRLPPSVDGLGDYGISLAKQLRSNFNIETEFIVADINWVGEATIDGFRVKKLLQRNKQSLLELLPGDSRSGQTVILHYVGYGYAKRGCPVWLIQALNQWKLANKKSNLVTMFHELFAFGPIWSSQFWTSPLQRFLAEKLCLISDHCLTSKKIYADILAKYSRGKHSEIPALPVFSNVGEPENSPELSDRNKRIVIFGSKVPRSRVYRNSREQLENLCSVFGINEIFDIGPPLEFEINPINGIPIQVLGIKSTKEISDILSSSLIGFINYPTEYLAKSGIFAAYCSHRIFPVAAYYEHQKIDSVEVNTHYWVNLGREAISMEHAQKISDNAHHWYQGHRLNEHAKAFMEFL